MPRAAASVHSRRTRERRHPHRDRRPERRAARRAAPAARPARRPRPRGGRAGAPRAHPGLFVGRDRRRPGREQASRPQEVRSKVGLSPTSPTNDREPRMSTTQAPARRGRRAPEVGPRASLKQLLPFLLEHRRVLVIVVVLSILGAIATLAQPLLVGELIGRVEADQPLGMMVWGVFALVVAASIITGFQHFLLQRTGTAVVYSSRRKLIGRILHLPISEFDARRTGDLVSRVGTDTTLLYAVLTQGLADAVGNSLVFVGALVAMALIDPALLGLIVLVIGVSIGGVTLLSGRIRTATRDQQEKVGQLSSGVERAVGSIRTVRAAGASYREEAAISALAQEAYDQGVRIAKVSALIVPIAGIALQLSLLVVLGVGGLRVASGAITVAALVTFIMFLFLLIAPLGSTFGAITSVNQALGALGRIQEILDLPTETQGDAELAASVRGADAPVAAGSSAALS